MACIEVQNAAGTVRTIPENTAYSSEWRFNGKVDMACGGQAELTGPGIEDKLSQEGVPWGDAIAWVTKKIGIKQCAPCKARQEILNHAKELGWAETIKQIKETL